MVSEMSPGAQMLRAAIAMLIALAAGTAYGAPRDVLVCTDARGRTITSDLPPPECADRPIREMRADGSVRRVIEPPLSAEQRAQRAAEERRKHDEDNRRRDQARRDSALLEAYSGEPDIEVARTRALDNRKAIVERVKKRMDELQRERKKLDSEAEFYANREQPDKLKRAYDTNKTMIQGQEKIIGDTEVEMKRINERFDAERKRFRELVQAGAKPASHTATTATR